MILFHDDVQLRPPKEDEYDFLVGLRNRERRWFVDQSELKYEDAVAWYATRHDGDRLLCIVCNGVVIGTIGWARVPTTDAAYEIGRTIGDYRAARRGGCDREQLHKAIRIAIFLVLDYLFGKLRADDVYARSLPENGRVRKVMREFQPITSDWPFAPATQDMECAHISSGNWPLIRDKVIQRIDERTQKAGPGGASGAALR